MNKSTAGLLIILALIAVLLGFNYFKHPFANSNQAAVTETPAPEVSPAPSAAPVVSGTTEEKIATLLAYPIVVPKAASSSAEVSGQAPILSDETNQDLAWITQHHPALITLFGTKVSTSSAQTMVTQLKAAYPITAPPLIAVDHEGGISQRLNGTGFTTLPSWQSLCDQSATQSAQILTKSLAEVKSAGVNVVFAPVVDVATHQPVEGNRVCSGNPDTVVARAAQYAQIANSFNLLPVFKHFPGIGASHLDLHQSFDRVTITPADALVYKQLLDQFPTAGVMVTHIGVINQFSDVPCSLSPDCIAELTSTYPQVLVISDALDMKAASYLPAASKENSASNSSGAEASTATARDLPQVAELAVRAGDQVLVFSQDVTAAQLDAVFAHLVATYNQDPSFQTAVDKAVTQIQATRQKLLSTQQ